ncbi:hypothetical protein C8A01DRAFT_15128 [Parachaetomium inaequale]|uniref:Uncharacterized protein n=1 Tax=Parachaetomium inaequale TaxID=2588326 RepID=A0AAN6PL37_9PEZI|nr:hypothetical protein C8A01DRAFT_15128 [Parachaetomium inaequale]
MDTVNKVAKAATKAIFGETSGEEPVSGQMGNVAAGEPYDAGNMGDPKEAALAANKKDTETQNTETPATSAPTTAPSEPAAATRTTSTTVPEPMTKPEPEAATKPRFVEAKSIPSQPSHETDQPANPAGPAKFAPSAIAMRGDSTKAQNDTRPPPSDEAKPATSTTGVTDIPGTATAKDEPTTSASNVTDDDKKTEKAEEEKKTLNRSDSSNPDVKLEGPGPRPLEEIAREHGGDAGAVNEPPQQQRETTTAAGAGGVAGEGGAGHQRRDSGKGLLGEEGEGEGEGEKGAGKQGGAGTGEEHVKSSGLAADGGDFDASRPGAAREADRLLEEKGVYKVAPGVQQGPGIESIASDTHPNNTGKEKVGLKDKIKAKLHKG